MWIGAVRVVVEEKAVACASKRLEGGNRLSTVDNSYGMVGFTVYSYYEQMWILLMRRKFL